MKHVKDKNVRPSKSDTCSETLGPTITAKLQQVNKEIKTQLNQSYKEFKLNDAGFDVLASLLNAGEPYALSPSQLLKKMHITSGTLTTRIDKLEKNGFVKRKIKKADKRSITVKLTKKGLHLIQEAMIGHVAAQQKVFKMLSDDEQKKLLTLLDKCLKQTTI